MSISYEEDDVTRLATDQEDSFDDDYDDVEVRRVDDFDDEEEESATEISPTTPPFAPLQNRLAAKAASMSSQTTTEATPLESQSALPGGQAPSKADRPLVETLSRPVEGGGGVGGMMDSADGIVTDKATTGQKVFAGGVLGLNAANGIEDLVGYVDAMPGGLEAAASQASEYGAAGLGSELADAASQTKEWGADITSFLGEATVGALGEVSDVINPISAGVKAIQSAGYAKDAIRQVGDRKQAKDLTDPVKQKRLAAAEEKAKRRRDEMKDLRARLEAGEDVSMQEKNRIRMRGLVGVSSLALERKKQDLGSNYQKTMDETAIALNAKVDSDPNNEASFKAGTGAYNAGNKGAELKPFERPVASGFGKGANAFKRGAATLSEGIASLFGVSNAESELLKGNAKTAAMSGGLATLGNSAKALTGGVSSIPGYGVNLLGKTLLGGVSDLLGADKAQQQETYDEIWGDEYQDSLTKFGLQARPQAEAVDVDVKPDMKWSNSGQTLRGTDRAGIPNSTWSSVKDGVYGATVKPLADGAKLLKRNWRSPADLGLRGTRAGIYSKVFDERRRDEFTNLPGSDAGLDAGELAALKDERRTASQAGYIPRSPVRDANSLFDDDEAPNTSNAPDSESFEFPDAGLNEDEAAAAKAERRAESEAGYTPASRATSNRTGTEITELPDFQDEPNELEGAIAATKSGAQSFEGPSARMAVEPGRGLSPFTSSPFIPRANPTPAAPKRRGGFLGRIASAFGRLFGRKSR
jgi:hypothetical protein